MFLLSCRGSAEPKLDGHVYNRENGINEVESKITTSRSLLLTTHDNRESSLHINQCSLSPAHTGAKLYQEGKWYGHRVKI